PPLPLHRRLHRTDRRQHRRSRGHQARRLLHRPRSRRRRRPHRRHHRLNARTTPVRTPRLLLALPLALAFAGCSLSYTAEVVNPSGRPVRARLLQDQVVDDPKVLAAERVNAGETVTLGPAKAVLTDNVVIEIEDLTDAGLPPHKLRLGAGRTTVAVTPPSHSPFRPAHLP